MKKYVYFAFPFFFALSACQEEVVKSTPEADIQAGVPFTFVYNGEEHTEYIDRLPSSMLDVPIPKDVVLLEAMQQPNATIFSDVKNSRIVIFDSVEEAERNIGISSVKTPSTNQRTSDDGGEVVIYSKPKLDCSNQGDCIGIGVGSPFSYRTYTNRLPDLSNLRFNDISVNMDRRVSSIRIANLSPSKWLTAVFYERQNYSGRALVLQCPPDMARPPIDYDASVLFADLAPKPTPSGNFLSLPLPTWLPQPPYRSATNNCSRGFISSEAGWDNRIRSIRAFFTSGKYQRDDCISL